MNLVQMSRSESAFLSMPYRSHLAASQCIGATGLRTDPTERQQSVVIRFRNVAETQDLHSRWLNDGGRVPH